MHTLVAAMAAFGTGLLFATLLRATPEPEPAPPAEPERDPDYCFTHKEIEKRDGK